MELTIKWMGFFLIAQGTYTQKYIQGDVYAT